MPDQPRQPLKLTAADLFPEGKGSVAPPEVHTRPPEVYTRAVKPAVKPVAAVTPSLHVKHPVIRPIAKKTRPVNVLHVRVVTGCGGGPEKTILRSPQYADASRYHMTAAYLYPQGDPGMCVIRDTAKSHGCPLYEVPETGAIDHHSIGALLNLCRDLDIDIWHGHDYKSNLIGLLLKRFHKMKLITTAHGFTRETWRTRLYYHLDNLAMLGYDRVITVSPQLLSHCARHGVNPDRLTYIPNAIDSNEYHRTRSLTDAKYELGMDRSRFAIGVIGRLSPEKGVDRAIHMMPAQLAEHPRVELHLIGDGPERERLEQLAQKLGTANHVHFWGWQSDTRQVYEALDALLLPSRTEGLPNVVLEAMAMGVPVAATNVGGVSDLLDNGNCGIILSDHDRSWASQINPLLADPAQHRSFAHKASQRVHNAFSFTKRMARIQAVYDSVMGRADHVTARYPYRQAA